MRINKILKDDSVSEVIRKIIGHFSDIADIITCGVISVFVYTIMVLIATGKLCGISPYIMLWMLIIILTAAVIRVSMRIADSVLKLVNAIKDYKKVTKE